VINRTNLDSSEDNNRPPPEWGGFPSLSGKHLLFGFSEGGSTFWRWVETDSLRVVRSWEMHAGGAIGVGDDQIATLMCDLSPKCEPQVMVRGISTGWTPIASAGLGALQIQFVSENALLISFNPLSGSAVKLMQTDGQVIFNLGQPPTKEGWGWCNSLSAASECGIVSADGKRFGIPGFRTEGGSASFDLGGHSVLKKLLFYELSSQHASIFDVGGPKITGEVQCAMSPDGLKLAILNDEKIEVFPLPTFR
jgi:hypothetical protein